MRKIRPPPPPPRPPPFFWGGGGLFVCFCFWQFSRVSGRADSIISLASMRTTAPRPSFFLHGALRPQKPYGLLGTAEGWGSERELLNSDSEVVLAPFTAEIVLAPFTAEFVLAPFTAEIVLTVSLSLCLCLSLRSL